MLFVLIVLGSICGLIVTPCFVFLRFKFSKLVKLLKDNDITF